MNKKRSVPALVGLIVITLLTALLWFAGMGDLRFGDFRVRSFDEIIVKGLDLKGGTSVLLEVQAPDLDAEGLDRVRSLIALRVDATGAVDPTITTEGTNRIRVDIPGKYESATLVEQLSRTGVLTFKDPEGNIVLEGKDIQSATPAYDEFGRFVVNLQMKDEGISKFAEATKANVGKSISINMDDEVLSNPVVNEPILDGQASITGQFDEDEARMLAAMINNGALPYPVKTVSVQEIGATLGTSVLSNVAVAGGLGLLAIVIFMFVFYRVAGIMASIALAIFALLLIYATAGLRISMSLAGIAGYLLSVGMAIDANILIFERIKEELAHKLEPNKAIKEGFHQAMSSIIDSNITTLLAGFILYYFGAGTVRGFAMNLVIGVILSLFTALVVSRFLMWLGWKAGMFNNPSAFGFKVASGKNFHFKFYKNRKFYYAISAVILTVGLVAGIVRGPNVGIDFAGGTQITLNFPGEINKAEVDAILQKFDPNITTQVVEGNRLEARSQTLNSSTASEAIAELEVTFSGGENFVESVNEIGSSIGAEQARKSILASVLAILGILAYVAFRFKFTLGVGAIVALIHDVIFTVGIYFIFRIPINAPLIAAILTIIGYSINDTVVVFDRIRGNLSIQGSKKLEDVTDESINQTLYRTVNTSVTLLFILLLVLFMVPQIRDFTLPLTLGVLSGVYSSVFIAAPIYVDLEKRLHGEKTADGAKPVKAAKLVTPEGVTPEDVTQGEVSTIREAAGSKKPMTYSNRYAKKARTQERDAARDRAIKDESNEAAEEVTEETEGEKEARGIPQADDFRFSSSSKEKLDKIKFDEDDY